MDNVVEISDLSFRYNDMNVLEGVNLQVPRGDFASIIGPNGGGKTTLLKLILGMLRPATGRIIVFGGEPEKARLRIGYVPQHSSFDPAFPVSALEVALMGRLRGGWPGRYRREDYRIAREALEMMRLQDVGDRPFSALSGGQRQRVLIARALAAQPELLLLDEPTANVDQLVEELLFEILRELNRRMTILLVSHDIGVVSQIVKSVICVNRRVYVHPTSAFTGDLVRELYGSDLRMVRHDHRCSEEGHCHV